MKIFRLKDMVGGWFVGDFIPSCYRTKDFEIGCKFYKEGEVEKKHVHKIATEITLVVKGSAKMNDVVYNSGDIVILNPEEATDFVALEDTITAVVKIPSIPNDKYMVEK